MILYTVFLAGVSMAAFLASGLFFLKLWKASQDKFFKYFAVACWFLSLERVVVLFVQTPLSPEPKDQTELSFWIYLLRLCAFIMILVAIVEKNRKRPQP
ncbi:DUF5985 family protein [Bdellovibrio sp. HCB337]|uniref:DUF5985 family protein n=1 Tax=Bdellovibrio sp. HCB337 TaxID=3394358 RepID=UPI0039A5F69F